MGETTRSPVGWRDLAAAVPGGVAIQVDDEFVHVEETMAAALAADDLTGEPWRTPFPDAEADRIERVALASAREDGRWEGEMLAGEARDPLDLTLTATDDGALVWVVEEPAGDADGSGDCGSSNGQSDGSGDCDSSADQSDGSGDGGSSADQSDVAPSAGRRDGESGRRPGPFARPSFARAIFDGLEDVFYVIDEDGEMIFWNEALLERTGYTHQEVDEMQPKRLVADDHHEYVPGLMDPVADVEDRRVDVDLLTKDGERLTHEFEGTTVADPETGEQFRCGVARDVTDQRSQEAELRRQRTLVQGILNTIPDVVFGYDADGDHIVEEALLDEFAGYPAEEMAEMEMLDFLPEADRETAREQFRRVRTWGETVSLETAIVRKDGRDIPHEFRAAPMELDGGERGFVAAARDITEPLERERELQRRRDELATLDRINQLLLDTARELIETASREAVERTVCEQLAGSDLYQFAWVGEREFDGDRIVPRTTAGDDRGYLDAVTITADRIDTGTGPAGEALRTGEVQVANVDDPAFEPWRDAASERGFESVAAVPLRHGESVYGVLVVYATREDAFSEREQSGFDVLGRTVGAVVHAARSRDLLFADAVVELEFRIDEADSALARVARQVGCELSLDGYVAAGEQWVLYVVVEDAPAAAVSRTAGDEAPVDRARVVREDETGGVVELVLSGSSLLQTTNEAGAAVRAATATPDSARVVVETPAGGDVREVVDRVQRAYPGADLRARRERDRDVATVGRPGGLLDELTDRQREVLEAAYRAGYFDWPRESTAEEVATSLDLASPTLHGHLRKAEHVLLSELFGLTGPET